MIGMIHVETEDPVKAEKDLWASVMLEAIESLSSKRPKQKREAEKWFDSRNQGVGSFLWVCSALEIPPGTVRRSVQNGCS